MRRIVPDESALALVIFGDPEGEAVSRELDGAALFAPTLLRYELQCVAAKECRRQPGRRAQVLESLESALAPQAGIVWLDPNPVDVVLVATATGLSTYDASYLCLAGTLEADLVTRDRKLSAALDPSSGE
jgi:predicted nucleic acid-binding protein